MAAVLSRLGHQDELLRTVFVTYPNPFPHVDAFVKVCIQRYKLDCVYIPGPMKQALQQYIDGSSRPTKAIFVGIRRTDPYAGKWIMSGKSKRKSGWLTACRETIAFQQNRPRLARFHACSAYHRLELQEHLGLFAWAQDTLLLSVRRRVKYTELAAGIIMERSFCLYSYTSLGSMENTYPNPELKDDSQPSGYRHACRLTDELHERDGRQGSSKK